jgi:hypothetical protein
MNESTTLPGMPAAWQAPGDDEGTLHAREMAALRAEADAEDAAEARAAEAEDAANGAAGWEVALAAWHNRLRPLTTSAPDCQAVPLGNRMFRLEAPGTTACHVDSAGLQGICDALASQVAARK